jgi:uncharacterized SAM-binding protein YcdF (DUF218 family)
LSPRILHLRMNYRSLTSKMTNSTNKYEKRKQIISYISPRVVLFPTTYALVFGTRHGVSDFVDDIVSLYDHGYFKSLIISGGVTRQGTVSEASTIFHALVKRGIPERSIIVEDKARNTGENVLFSRAMAKDLQITEILLIGKISSKRRYIMTVRKQWPEIRKICCHGVNYFSCDVEHWWKDTEFRTRVISECRKLCSYIERGFISDISIVDGVVV